MLTKHVLFVLGKDLQLVDTLPVLSNYGEGTYAYVSDLDVYSGWYHIVPAKFLPASLDPMIWEPCDVEDVPAEYRAAILLLT